MLELLDRRVLGAVRYVDATTGLPIRRQLDVGGLGIRVMRNVRGLYVLCEAPELALHTTTFQDPPKSPTVGGLAVTMSVADPIGRFLPRRHTVLLPRDPDPAHAEQADSLFRAADVPLFPSPLAPIGAGWSVLRVTVVRQGSGAPLPGALLRVVSGGNVVARGLSEWRGATAGEALIAVPGVPVTTWGDDAPGTPVVVNEVAGVLEVYFDPRFDPAAGEAPDPDRLEAARAGLPSASAAVQLASGRLLTKTLPVAVP
jgi:hypothetical protein